MNMELPALSRLHHQTFIFLVLYHHLQTSATAWNQSQQRFVPWLFAPAVVCPNSFLTSYPLLACVDSPRVFAGTSTPPSIAATPVPALPPPIAVNSYASVPAPPNGQSATEALYTNGVHAYQGTAVLLSVLQLGCIGNNRVAETKDPSSRGPPF